MKSEFAARPIGSAGSSGPREGSFMTSTALRPVPQSPPARESLDTETTIRDFQNELVGIGPSMLNLHEQLTFRAFSPLYRAYRAFRRRPHASDVLSAPELRVRQKTRMAVDGLLRGEETSERLSGDECRRFARDGVLGPFDLHLDSAERADLIKRCRRAPDVFPHLLDPGLLRIALDPRITQRVQSILGREVDIVRSSVFVKEANVPGQHSVWHMAPSSNYGAEERAHETDYVTVWTALTPAGKANGCLKILPGSFAIYPNGLLLEVAGQEVYLDDPFDAFLAMCIKKKLSQDTTTSSGSRFDRFISNRVNASVIIQKLLTTNDFLYDEIRRLGLEARFLECDPGQFFIFTSENYHGSIPNISGETRVAYVVRYGTPRARLSQRDKIKGLIEALPASIRGRLSGSDGGYLVPTLRAAGAPIRGEHAGRMYLSPRDLEAKD